MQYVLQALFLILSGSAIYIFSKRIGEIKTNILSGKDFALTNTPKERLKNLILLAFGQRKMFKNWPVAIMHFIIYAGFIIINVEVIEIILDGILGTHRLFASTLGSFYTFLINVFEILAFLVLAVCVVFLIRRNVMKLKRFMSNDLNGWPRSDANYILIAEIILMSLFIIMNAADRQLQLQGNEHYHNVGSFIISGNLSSIFNGWSSSSLIIFERVCWWLHIIGIFIFLNYLPYSKHLHVLLAFPNAYFAQLGNNGKMENMPRIQNEVLYMMEPEKMPTTTEETIGIFGAKEVTDLSWKNLLDAYSCTECGRCSTACPANQTGKKLSPRHIMMATRDRMEDRTKIMKANNGNFVDDGKTLLNDYITVEELRACTTCNACVEECPVSISPLSIINELRRSLIMEDSNAPQEWNGMFSNMESNFAPWKYGAEKREEWFTQ